MVAAETLIYFITAVATTTMCTLHMIQRCSKIPSGKRVFERACFHHKVSAKSDETSTIGKIGNDLKLRKALEIQFSNRDS